jgi:hypothetical protein
LEPLLKPLLACAPLLDGMLRLPIWSPPPLPAPLPALRFVALGAAVLGALALAPPAPAPAPPAERSLTPALPARLPAGC